MGFNVAIVAVRGISPDRMYTRFGLQPTSSTESEPESRVVAAALPSGWHLFYFNDCNPPSESVLASLSCDAKVLFLNVSETVMVSNSRSWRDGQMIWSILHDCDNALDIAPRHLEVIGDPPTCFQAISDRLHDLQNTEGGADYIFDIPVEVFKEITGFRYDGNPDGWGVDTFIVMQRLRAPRKWWQFW